MLDQNITENHIETPPVEPTIVKHQMLHIDNWNRPFWRSVVSNPLGGGSTARLAAMLIILSTLVDSTYLIIRTHAIPDNIMKLGFFASLLVSVIYHPSKISDVVKSYTTKK